MRTYLDNAATSWPKPEPVYAAVDRYQREVGAPAGRGAYSSAVEAQRTVDDARRALAVLLNAPDPNRIVFGANGTDVLNLAIHGVLRAGDHAVTTVCEHNSVLRPLADAHRRVGIEVTHVRCDAAGYVDPADVRAALKPNTRLVAVTHASNVTGAVQPVADIARIAREAGALSLVDAAQSAGHIPLDVASIDADLVAASGHKGLLGPLGTALLYVRSGAEQHLAPTRQGGAGLHSTSDAQPDELPHRYEAGNLNVPALAGLAAAAKFLAEETVAKIAAHEADLVARLLAGLRELPTIRVYGPAADQTRAPVVAFAALDFDPQDFAAALDSSFGIQCRAGLHCAPRVHESLGTLGAGGLVRLSVGWSTTREDVTRALEAIAALAGASFA